MASPLDRGLDQIAADYARYRARAVEAQHQLRDLSGSATSAQGLVTVGVGARGELRSVVFNSREYRAMAPAELAHAVLDTIERARRSVLQQLVELMPVTSFGGVTVRDMLDGDVDWDRVLPERLATDGLPARREDNGRG